MHEFGITQKVLEIALASAEREGASRITKITVKAGEMEGIVADSMQFHFEHLRQGTIAEEAELVVDEVPLIIKCKTCGEESHVAPFEVVYCPKCTNFTVEIVSGKELLVDSIETV
ncbi:MAG: hydrogenase maturation nickel metallochaperone HypA [Candidatus Aquicultorales bacterium]